MYSSDEDQTVAEERALVIDMYKFYIDEIFRPLDQLEESKFSADVISRF